MASIFLNKKSLTIIIKRELKNTTKNRDKLKKKKFSCAIPIQNITYINKHSNIPLREYIVSLSL